MRLPQCDSPTVLVEITPSVCRAVVPRQPQNNVFPQIKKRMMFHPLFSSVRLPSDYSAGASVGASVDWAGASVAGVVPIVAGASV